MILFCINGAASPAEPRRAGERCRSRTGRAAPSPARRGNTAGLRGAPRLLLPPTGTGLPDPRQPGGQASLLAGGRRRRPKARPAPGLVAEGRGRVCPPVRTVPNAHGGWGRPSPPRPGGAAPRGLRGRGGLGQGQGRGGGPAAKPAPAHTHAPGAAPAASRSSCKAPFFFLRCFGLGVALSFGAGFRVFFVYLFLAFKFFWQQVPAGGPAPAQGRRDPPQHSGRGPCPPAGRPCLWHRGAV